MRSFPSDTLAVRQLLPGDVPLLRGMLTMFGEAFEDVKTYTRDVPSIDYHQRLLASDTFIAIAALKGDDVIGGIAAYELPKFERPRKEIYLYDLAVASAHRRQGVATALIRMLQKIAASRGAYVIFVQADRGDAPALALYEKLGVREDVFHFDLPPLPEKT
jgi:aminoglycoside 3-N-acetyltransferase I